RWADAEGYIENLKKWKFLKDLYPQKIGYISAPFDSSLVSLDLSDKKPLELGIDKILNLINNKIKNILVDEQKKKYEQQLLGNKSNKEGFKEFLERAGGYFSFESTLEKVSIGHMTSNEIRFYKQIINMVAGAMLFLAENPPHGPDRKKVLLVDNNPDRELCDIDKRFEEIIKNCKNGDGADTGKSITLREVLSLMGDFVEAYYYTGDFRSLYNTLLEIKQEEPLSIEVFKDSPNSDHKEKESVDIKDLDFILVDIFLGEEEPSGIDIINLLAVKYPAIPCFALSVCDDFDIIKYATGKGADYYIIKNQIFSILYIYYRYIAEMGKLIKLL
ncbi:MAG: hypothetical protein DRG83_05965, partial [Deltaproteobacteria bacterium]